MAPTTTEASRQEQILNSDSLISGYENEINKYISECCTPTEGVVSPFLTIDQIKGFASTIVSKALDIKKKFERLWFSYDQDGVIRSFSVRQDAQDALADFIPTRSELRHFDEEHAGNVFFNSDEIEKKETKFRNKKLFSYGIVTLMFLFDLSIFWQMLINTSTTTTFLLSLIAIFGTLIAIDGLPALAGSRLASSRHKSSYAFENDAKINQKRKNRKIEGIVLTVLSFAVFVGFSLFRISYLQNNISGEIPPSQWLSIIAPIATSIISFFTTLNLYSPVGIEASERRRYLVVNDKVSERKLRACLINLGIAQSCDPTIAGSVLKDMDDYRMEILKKMEEVDDQKLGDIAYITCENYVKSLDRKTRTLLNVFKESVNQHCFDFDGLLGLDIVSETSELPKIESMDEMSSSIKKIFPKYTHTN
jgi:hypothetical protein